MTTHVKKLLLGIQLFELSNNFIYKLRLNKEPVNVYKYLPTYTINTNKESHNRPMTAEYFLQFIGLNELSESVNEKYLFFNILLFDELLIEECSQCGEEEFFSKFDFKMLLSNFKPHTEADYNNSVFKKTNYLLIDFGYTNTYDPLNGMNEWDFDLSYDFTGFLNENMEVIKFS